MGRRIPCWHPFGVHDHAACLPGSGGPKTGQEIQVILPLFGPPRLRYDKGIGEQRLDLFERDANCPI